MKHLILIGVLALGLITTAQAANEGIQVHGHWQFDIYNKDGSFDRKVEFENALDPNQGSTLLANLLTGNTSIGFWNIIIRDNLDDNDVSSGLCLDIGLRSCKIHEGLDPNEVATPSSFLNLTVTNVNNTIVLNGFFVANTSSSIKQVATYNEACNSSYLPRSCDLVNSSSYYFTKKNLTSPVPVQAGQTVNVTVTISFS